MVVEEACDEARSPMRLAPLLIAALFVLACSAEGDALLRKVHRTDAAAATEPDGHDGHDDGYHHNETESHNETDHGHDDEHDEHEEHEGQFDPVARLLSRVSEGRANMTEKEFEAVFEHVIVERSSVAYGEEGHEHGHRRRRSLRRAKRVARRAGHAKRSAGLACQTARELFAQHDADGSNALEASELPGAFAHSFVLLDQGCFAATCNSEPSTSQTWGFGFLSVVIISLVGFLAVVLLPVKSQAIKHHVLITLVAFGFGAIAGDLLFHILPALFAVHSHEEEGAAAVDANMFVWRMAVVFAAFVVFFVLERIILQVFRGRAEGHSHLGEPTGPEHETAENLKLDLRQITSLGWMNLISDGLHNFVDGLALGAAWSVSLSLGLGTSLAILFHEIPQEISDFSILVRAGFPRRWALVANFLSAVPAFLGLVIAIPIAESANDAQMWVLAITAGGFVYIAFVLLLPELLAKRLSLLHQLEVTIGMAVGFVALLLIAVYEENIVYGFCL